MLPEVRSDVVQHPLDGRRGLAEGKGRLGDGHRGQDLLEQEPLMGRLRPRVHRDRAARQHLRVVAHGGVCEGLVRRACALGEPQRGVEVLLLGRETEQVREGLTSLRQCRELLADLTQVHGRLVVLALQLQFHGDGAGQPAAILLVGGRVVLAVSDVRVAAESVVTLFDGLAAVGDRQVRSGQLRQRVRLQRDVADQALVDGIAPAPCTGPAHDAHRGQFLQHVVVIVDEEALQVRVGRWSLHHDLAQVLTVDEDVVGIKKHAPDTRRCFEVRLPSLGEVVTPRKVGDPGLLASTVLGKEPLDDLAGAVDRTGVEEHVLVEVVLDGRQQGPDGIHVVAEHHAEGEQWARCSDDRDRADWFDHAATVHTRPAEVKGFQGLSRAFGTKQKPQCLWYRAFHNTLDHRHRSREPHHHEREQYKGPRILVGGCIFPLLSPRQMLPEIGACLVVRPHPEGQDEPWRPNHSEVEPLQRVGLFGHDDRGTG